MGDRDVAQYPTALLFHWDYPSGGQIGREPVAEDLLKLRHCSGCYRR